MQSPQAFVSRPLVESSFPQGGLHTIYIYKTGLKSEEGHSSFGFYAIDNEILFIRLYSHLGIEDTEAREATGPTQHGCIRERRPVPLVAWGELEVQHRRRDCGPYTAVAI